MLADCRELSSQQRVNKESFSSAGGLKSKCSVIEHSGREEEEEERNESDAEQF
jgi:hypothetical protein